MPEKSPVACFLNPRSIAVVGAGERPTSSGGAVLRNLRVSGYTGRIVPINPKGGAIDGLKVAVSLRAMDAPVDLVAVLVRPDSTIDAVREARGEIADHALHDGLMCHRELNAVR